MTFTTAIPGDRGSAIVEVLVLLPAVSLLMAGILATGNQLAMLSAAESASHAETLRSARGQSTLSGEWNALFPDGAPPYRFRDSHGKSSMDTLGWMPGLSGRSTVAVSLDRDWNPSTRSFLGLERQSLQRSGSLSGDCWNAGSKSGRKIGKAVKVMVATGIVR
jgi:hypothetical protein